MIERKFTLESSFEQGEEIMEYHLGGGRLVILDSEKARLMRAAERRYPGCTIVDADLSVETGDWTVKVTVKD